MENAKGVELYTVKEVSVLMHTSPEYVYSLIKKGLLPAIKFRSIRVRKSSLEEFLETYDGCDLSNIDEVKKLEIED